MSRPVIGLTGYGEVIDRGPWRAQPTTLLPQAYADAVGRAGGIPMLVPPLAWLTDADAAVVLARLDGLVLTGGADVAAECYGAAAHPLADRPRRDRDHLELTLARVSAAAGLPVLGVCRGMQVMAVAAGARLVQHLPDLVGSDVHRPTLGAKAQHDIEPVAGTRVAAILGVGPREVPTHHHQAVDPASLGATAYRASAWHADGTLEAMEVPGLGFRVAVQWHPEEGTDDRLFVALVASAAEHG